ncbi:MAG: hypothetical protein ACI8W3_003401 [Myxococcota bacterium]|jgi:hypothetical protein
MANSDEMDSPELASESPAPAAPVAAEPEPLDPQSFLRRLYSFRFTFVAIAIFILLYIFTIRSLEGYLYRYFGDLTRSALQVTDFRYPISSQIQFKVDGYIKNSTWTTFGGVDVAPIILGRDGYTLIYVAGRAPSPPPQRFTLADILAEADALLPASAYLTVTIPHNSVLANAILILYAGLMMQVLWLRSLSTARRQRLLLEQAIEERKSTESRTRSIEEELDLVRSRFRAVEPTEPEQVSEVNQLRDERKLLESKLHGLESRELELRESTAHAGELNREINALEDLLEEASEDLATRDSAIRELERNLKRASKDAATEEASRMKESEVLTRRFSTLYRNLEIDDRAISDIVALRDEPMKLKCEEKLKRLNDEADNLAVRRKVGGIPPHLTIFEMGFAGKGRLYYMKGSQRRFRVLNVGAKNTQNASIEYLRKL